MLALRTSPKQPLTWSPRWQSALLPPLLLLALAGFLSLRAAPPPETGNRYLFVVDTSSSMKRMVEPLQKTLFELIDGGLEGWMRNGDTYGLWTYSDENSTAFPMQVWTERQKQGLGAFTAGFLRKQPFKKRGRLAVVLPDLFAVINAVKDVTVVIISDGESPIKGTPFDPDINAVTKRVAAEMRAAKKPVIIALVAQGGQIVKWGVNSPEMMVPLPKPPPPPQLAPPAMAGTPTNAASPNHSVPPALASAPTNAPPPTSPDSLAAKPTSSPPELAGASPVASGSRGRESAPSSSEQDQARPSSPLAAQGISARPDSENALPKGAPAAEKPVISTSSGSTNETSGPVVSSGESSQPGGEVKMTPGEAAASPTPVERKPPAAPRATRRAPIILTKDSVTNKMWADPPENATAVLEVKATVPPASSNPAPAVAASLASSGTNSNPAGGSTNSDSALPARGSMAVAPTSAPPATATSAFAPAVLLSLNLPPSAAAPSVQSSNPMPGAGSNAPVDSEGTSLPSWLSRSNAVLIGLVGAGGVVLGAALLGGLSLWRARLKKRQPSLITRSLLRKQVAGRS
jgi:hypothetical protein